MDTTLPTFSPLIIGCMRLGAWGAKMTSQELSAFIDGCLELGLNDFDHADIYGGYTTEEDFGKVLKDRPDLREKIQLTTKCGINMVAPNREYRLKSYDSSAQHIISSVYQSLKNLHTEYLDVLLIHRPDFLMDPHAIAETFSKLQQQGSVRHFGVSNFSPGQFNTLHSLFPLVTNQVEASILHLNPFRDGTFTTCLQHKVRPSAWSPLGGGRLFGPLTDTTSQRLSPVLDRIQQKYNCGLDQLLLAFLLRHPSGIIPVLGTSKVDRIASAQKALGIKLDREDWYELWQSSTGHKID